MTIEEIRKNAPCGADHYMVLFNKVKYLQKTNKPTIMTKIAQFMFRIKPLY